MATSETTTVVMVDDGSGPVAALKDTSGRIITAQQIQMIRDKQDADAAKVTDIKDKLVAGDAATITLIVGQTRDELNLRLAMLERQRGELQATLDKLQAGDVATTQNVVARMVSQLERRVALITDSRNRSDQLLTQIATKTLTVTPTPVQPAETAPITKG